MAAPASFADAAAGGDNYLWQTGLAGAIPSAVCFVLAVGFLPLPQSRRSRPRRRDAAAALLALNPNLLYLQSTPLTEPVFLACLMALPISQCFRARTWRRSSARV
jgi:hypothetical protein